MPGFVDCHVRLTMQAEAAPTPIVSALDQRVGLIHASINALRRLAGRLQNHSITPTDPEYVVKLSVAAFHLGLKPAERHFFSLRLPKRRASSSDGFALEKENAFAAELPGWALRTLNTG